MHDDRQIVEERITRFLAQVVRPAVHRDRVDLELAVWHVPGEPVPVSDALAAGYVPMALGDSWGAPWSTSWLKVTGRVPRQWAGRRVEAVFDLGFDPARGPGGQAELVHDAAGSPVQGLHPHHRSVLLTEHAAGGEPVELLVELAANPAIEGARSIGTGSGSLGTAHLHRLREAHLAVREEAVWHLRHDMEVLDELMRELPVGGTRRHEILRALARAIDAVDVMDVAGTAQGARDVLADVLSRPAYASAHTVTAVGHAPVDSAWLWPVRETARTCARTFTTVTTLAAEYPELVFACSSAQQYAWMKEHRPEIFERIKKAVVDGNWAPVGGMWVEADGNLPGGEALARQLVLGRRFFAEEFGVAQEGVWLPDSSGCTAAYPQLARLAGARWFLARKLSWNATNRLPHHTFDWEGIDGTRVFTHFPPVDTYDAALTGAELAHAESNFADKGAATRSLVPFGFGDGGGGGGPTREMLERARRLRDLEGSTKVRVGGPAEFFAAARAEKERLPVWRGELYLEDHRGTYTGQARTKQGNRRAEALLREAELWSVAAAVRTGAGYPYARLESIWRRVLLNQVHDILPGSPIAPVHQEAEKAYADVREELAEVIGGALAGGEGLAFFIAGPYPRREVVVLPAGTDAEGGQPLSGGRRAVLVEAPALGTGRAVAPDAVPPVAASAEDGVTTLDNGVLRVRIDAQGLVRSAYDLRARREAIAPGAAGNLLQLHPDDPDLWSARNIDGYDRDTVRDLTDAVSVELVESGPLLASVRVERALGDSHLVQHLELAAGSDRLEVRTEIDWQERDTLLKAAWPVDVHAETEAAEIQFGHVHRPTHENTGWDAARFELWAHRWVHVGEYNWGAALVNDSTYGHDVSRQTREDGGSTTTVRLSLLRSPHSPDPRADRGRHRFGYALVVGADIGDAVAAGYAVNLPLRPAAASPAGGAPLLTVDNPDIVVEAVKLADDRGGDVVVRLYESRGGSAKGALRADFAVAGAAVTDLLENPVGPLAPDPDGSLPLELRPFQILTLRLHRA